jgi:hypothetical protein
VPSTSGESGESAATRGEADRLGVRFGTAHTPIPRAHRESEAALNLVPSTSGESGQSAATRGEADRLGVRFGTAHTPIPRAALAATRVSPLEPPSSESSATVCRKTRPDSASLPREFRRRWKRSALSASPLGSSVVRALRVFPGARRKEETNVSAPASDLRGDAASSGGPCCCACGRMPCESPSHQATYQAHRRMDCA